MPIYKEARLCVKRNQAESLQVRCTQAAGGLLEQAATHEAPAKLKLGEVYPWTFTALKLITTRPPAIGRPKLREGRKRENIRS